MSICRSLARLMGGDAWAESQQGKGSDFYATAALGTMAAPPDSEPSSEMRAPLIFRCEPVPLRLRVPREPSLPETPSVYSGSSRSTSTLGLSIASDTGIFVSDRELPFDPGDSVSSGHGRPSSRKTSWSSLITGPIQRLVGNSSPESKRSGGSSQQHLPFLGRVLVHSHDRYPAGMDITAADNPACSLGMEEFALPTSRQPTLPKEIGAAGTGAGPRKAASAPPDVIVPIVPASTEQPQPVPVASQLPPTTAAAQTEGAKPGAADHQGAHAGENDTNHHHQRQCPFILLTPTSPHLDPVLSERTAMGADAAQEPGNAAGNGAAAAGGGGETHGQHRRQPRRRSLPVTPTPAAHGDNTPPTSPGETRRSGSTPQPAELSSAESQPLAAAPPQHFFPHDADAAAPVAQYLVCARCIPQYWGANLDRLYFCLCVSCALD